MTFTADGKEYLWFFILCLFSYYSQQIKIFSLYSTDSRRQTAKVSFLPFAVWRNVMLNLSNIVFWTNAKRSFLLKYG